MWPPSIADASGMACQAFVTDTCPRPSFAKAANEVSLAQLGWGGS